MSDALLTANHMARVLDAVRAVSNGCALAPRGAFAPAVPRSARSDDAPRPTSAEQTVVDACVHALSCDPLLFQLSQEIVMLQMHADAAEGRRMLDPRLRDVIGPLLLADGCAIACQIQIAHCPALMRKTLQLPTKLHTHMRDADLASTYAVMRMLLIGAAAVVDPTSPVLAECVRPSFDHTYVTLDATVFGAASHLQPLDARIDHVGVAPDTRSLLVHDAAAKMTWFPHTSMRVGGAVFRVAAVVYVRPDKMAYDVTATDTLARTTVRDTTTHDSITGMSMANWQYAAPNTYLLLLRT